MKRAQYTERGPDPQASIAAVESATPEPAAGQALLEVLAAPINPSDVLTLTGLYGMLPPLPAVGGNEGVGRVLALGPDTQGPAIGQTVLLPVGCGTWSTHVLADAKMESPTLPPCPFMNHWLHIWSGVMRAFYNRLVSTINDAVHALNPLPCCSTGENK